MQNELAEDTGIKLALELSSAPTWPLAHFANANFHLQIAVSLQYGPIKDRVRLSHK